jgi:hypothetical protein
MSISAACGRRGPARCGGGHADFRLQRQFVVARSGMRHHARRIEDAGFFHHVARLDAGRFSMKATLDGSSAVTVPAAMAAALSALNCST